MLCSLDHHIYHGCFHLVVVAAFFVTHSILKDLSVEKGSTNISVIYVMITLYAHLASSAPG